MTTEVEIPPPVVMPAQAGIHNPPGFCHPRNWTPDQARGDDGGYFGVMWSGDPSAVMLAQAGIQCCGSVSVLFGVAAQWFVDPGSSPG
ncbi:hypothetical protein [Microbulbifer guangxiensis]|uniref:hypothetical protein n=1 Tax=Microbulbifer guangxiensis TaxID=2904249 RepID=UPI001F18C21C|nr:hypothetical protein [Microbulbifer guangxiensis]